MVDKNVLEILKNVVPKDKKVIIFNVGTNKVVFDSVAPLVGTLLGNIDTNYKVYGNMDYPIHALNVNDWVDIVKGKHKNDFIIGIDACISSKVEIGELFIRFDSVRPGSGAGKKLSEIGDISILGSIAKEKSECNNCKFSTVLTLANNIVDTLVEFDRLRKEEEVAI